MVRIALLTVVLVLVMPSGRALSDEPKPAKATTLEDDLKKLEGKWSTADKQPLQWTVTIQLSRKGGKIGGEDAAWVIDQNKGQFKLEVSGPFEVKEVEKKRFIAPDKISVLAGFPATIGYRFDGETLILIAAEGDFKGEYKLDRVNKK